MPTSRQRKQGKARGVKTTPLPPRGPKDRPGHLVTKREAFIMLNNVLHSFLTSPQLALAVQNIMEFGTATPPAPPPPPSPEELTRAAKVLDALEPERPSGLVVVSA